MKSVTALEAEAQALKTKLDSVALPPELKNKAQVMVDRLQLMTQFSGYSAEYERTAQYIEWIVNLPWDKSSEDKLDLNEAKKFSTIIITACGTLKTGFWNIYRL